MAQLWRLRGCESSRQFSGGDRYCGPSRGEAFSPGWTLVGGGTVSFTDERGPSSWSGCENLGSPLCESLGLGDH